MSWSSDSHVRVQPEVLGWWRRAHPKTLSIPNLLRVQTLCEAQLDAMHGVDPMDQFRKINGGHGG